MNCGNEWQIWHQFNLHWYITSTISCEDTESDHYILMSFKTCLAWIFLWSMKEDILKNVANQNVSWPLISIVLTKKKKGISQNIFFYVEQKIKVIQVWKNTKH